MNWKSLTTLSTLLCAAQLAPALAAQDTCPRTRAELVPERVTVHATITCSGVTVDVPGVAINLRGDCPTLITAVPEHEIAVATDSRTRADVTGTLSGRIITMSCRTSYLLFLVPVGTGCEIESDDNYGTYMRLVTTGCTGLGS